MRNDFRELSYFESLGLYPIIKERFEEVIDTAITLSTVIRVPNNLGVHYLIKVSQSIVISPGTSEENQYRCMEDLVTRLMYGVEAAKITFQTGEYKGNAQLCKYPHISELYRLRHLNGGVKDSIENMKDHGLF